MPLDDWRKKQQEDAAKGKEYLLGLIPALKAAGAKALVVNYDGSGDSGEIQSIKEFSDDEREVEIEVLGLDTQAIDNAACDILSGQGIDWYNNEGGFGNVVVRADSDKILIENNRRVEESVYDEQTV